MQFTHAQDRAMADVLAERVRQDAKWGVQNHGPHIWLAILMEEVGEVAKEIADGLAANDWTPSAYRAELVQATAVGLAAIECFDRNDRPMRPCPKCHDTGMIPDPDRGSGWGPYWDTPCDCKAGRA